MASILMVEDSPTNAALYAAFLEQADHTVTVADTGKAALSSLEADRPELMLLDLQLPDMNGLDLLEKLPEGIARIPIIVLTGNGSVRAAASAMRAGAVDFLMKPCSAEKLVEAVDAGLQRYQPSTLTAPSPSRPDSSASGSAPKKPGSAPTLPTPGPGPSGFFGRSPAMENVFALIEAAAKSAASVFVTGESGTGKELCAQAIHKSGPRHNGPFVPLNCAAIPRELIESEIFGHRKGSFTGAVSDREGAASMADGGTLFLDEICEMDLDLQAKLLRFIQTGTYRRVGDSADRQTDIRFVCATNRDPFEEVRAGRFREDLYYRLHVVPINMPPLRDRGKDVQHLAERFLLDFSSIEGKGFQGFSEEAIARVRAYPWPGNVRQLENAMRNVVVLHDGDVVEPHMLPILPTPGAMAMPAPANPNGGPSPAPAYGASAPMAPPPAAAESHGGFSAMGDPPDSWFVRPIEELEILAIDAAIREFDGNVTQASRALNISTSSIYRKKKAWEDSSK